LQTEDAEGQIGAESTGIGSSRNGDVICKARNKVTCSVRNSLNALNDSWRMGCLQLCGISVSNTARQRHVYICHVKKSDMYKWVEEWALQCRDIEPLWLQMSQMRLQELEFDLGDSQTLHCTAWTGHRAYFQRGEIQEPHHGRRAI
jgi:hypothetical protein